MFTAAALLTLAEQDKIKMNEPIGNRVKGLNPKLSQVTPHHLLSNSAGIRDFAAPIISNDDASLGNMVRGWKDDVFFAGQGEIYSYSSAGFWLSGFVVEDLYGKPYADAMTELLLMKKSGERKFTFGEQNENEVVFVPGKSGKIEFLFTELYGAKKIR